MTFVQCTSTDHETRDVANMLLKDMLFPYKDLNTGDPKMVLHLQFMLQLLNMVHLQYVNSTFTIPIPVCPPLGTYVGVIALCRAAVGPIDLQINLTDNVMYVV